VIAALSGFVARIPPDDPLELWTANRPTALLAVIPVLTLGVVTLRSSFSEIAYAGHRRYFLIVAVALVYLLAGCLLYPALKSWAVPQTVTRSARAVALAVAVSFFVGTVWAPWVFGASVGMVGVLVAFMIAAAVFLFGLGVIAEHLRPPQAFTLLRLRRTPIFVLLLLWAVLAAVVDRSGSYYDVRKIEPAQAEVPCITRMPNDRNEAARCHNWTAAEELAAWLQRNTTTVSATPRPAVPLVFVATEGGGIRAGVISEPSGPGEVAKKHIGPPQCEELAAELGFALPKPVVEWIRASWRFESPRKDGSVVALDPLGVARSERQFSQALLTEVTFPKLDGSSKDAAYMKIKFAPESIRSAKAGAKAQ